jgi:ABC-type uncharacterized transport system YnjBCD substrate-binding protein
MRKNANKTNRFHGIFVLLFALTLSAGVAGCGGPPGTSGENASPPATGEDGQTAKSVETDLAEMTWDEVLAEAEGQTLNLNVYNADTQVSKYWDYLAEEAKGLGITVNIVSETADTDARMISDYESGATASYDMTWGYGSAIQRYKDAGCLWGDAGEEWARYLPNGKYLDWGSNKLLFDSGVPTDYMESPLMGLTPMMIYLSTYYDASLAWDAERVNDAGNTVYGLFHDLTELSQWVRKHPGKFTYLDLLGSGGFHGQMFLKSIMYELKDDGDGGWMAVYDPADDSAARYEKIEANTQAWYEWVKSADAGKEAFAEKSAYIWAYLDDLAPYLLQGDSGPLYGSDAYAMADYVNAGVLATSFTTCLSISPKLENDPSYLSGAGQAYLMQTSVFASDFVVVAKNSASKAAAMALANLMLDPEVHAKGFGTTGNTYNLDLDKLSDAERAYFDTVFDGFIAGSTPSAEDLAHDSHVDVGGPIGGWLSELWSEKVANA